MRDVAFIVERSFNGGRSWHDATVQEGSPLAVGIREGWLSAGPWDDGSGNLYRNAREYTS